MNLDINGLLNMAAQKSNSPFASQGIQAIANNDSKAGEQLANNILASLGMSKEEGIAKAKQFFGMQ